MAKFARTQWDSPTGVALAVYHQPAQGAARGIVHIHHGLAEHAARYARFAAFLSARGFHVYAHDHRGHGHTRAADAPQGRFAGQGGWAKVVDDAAFVAECARKSHPGLPLILFGHSMGGVAAFDHLLGHPHGVRAAAIWNAALNAASLAWLMRLVLDFERWLNGPGAPSGAIKALTFDAWGKRIRGARTPFDWLSHDQEEVDAYVNDPLCGWAASVSMWRDFTDGLQRCAEGTRLAAVPRGLPFHLLGGAEDPATGGGAAIRDLETRLEKAGFTDVTADVLPGARHESLNEINRDQTMADFAAWLDRIVPAGGGR
ncbi:MAG: alpha/beta hydrolase [Maricaulaceae bacterium]|nr:alpha/beta hydrolase [Maricaulaceae bacterium]